MGAKWTAEELDWLRREWARGTCAKTIARMTGYRRTPKAILDRASMMKLERRNRPIGRACDDLVGARRLRESLGLTQRQWARELGVHYSGVSHWECGHARYPEWAWASLRRRAGKAPEQVAA